MAGQAMQFAPGQEPGEAGAAGISGQAAAALQYYSHDAMQVRSFSGMKRAICLSGLELGSSR